MEAWLRILADNPIGPATELDLPNVTANAGTLSNIFSKVFFFIGALSLVMLIFGGFKYVTSSGNSDKAKEAWLTILYALIGLGVSISAFLVVQFVISKTP